MESVSFAALLLTQHKLSTNVQDVRLHFLALSVLSEDAFAYIDEIQLCFMT